MTPRACWAVARRGGEIAGVLAWLWVALESTNAAVHTIWALASGEYRPGLATAPLLLAAAFWLALELRRSDGAVPARRAA